MAPIEIYSDSSVWSARAAALRHHSAGLRVMHAAIRLHYGRSAECEGMGPHQSVGLFIPFEKACKAVEEFIETDGALPKSINGSRTTS